MHVIPPIPITTSMLTSSTVVETPPAVWNSGTTYAINNTVSIAGAAGLMTVYKSLQNTNINHLTSDAAWWVNIGTTYQVYSGAATYALGDYVIDATNHIIYQSLIAGNIGQALTDKTKWFEVGPTNTWAMFDILRNTASVQPTSITFSLTPGVRIDSLALLGIVANDLQVDITVSAVNVYSYTASLSTRHINNWYDYFFLPFRNTPSIVLLDLPPYSTSVITITLSGLSSISLGACIIGMNEYLGSTQYSPISDSLNFSEVTRDFAGGTSVMVQRRNVPKTEQTIWTSKDRINRIIDVKNLLGGTPAVWVGINDNTSDFFESLLILGFYKNFSFNHAYPDYSIISLTVEEI